MTGRALTPNIAIAIIGIFVLHTTKYSLISDDNGGEQRRQVSGQIISKWSKRQNLLCCRRGEHNIGNKA